MGDDDDGDRRSCQDIVQGVTCATCDIDVLDIFDDRACTPSYAI